MARLKSPDREGPLDLKLHADRPDMLWQNWALLADAPTFVPVGPASSNGGQVGGGHEDTSDPPHRQPDVGAP